MVPESIKQHHRFTVWLIVAVAIRNKIERGWGHDPDPSKTNFNSGDVVQFVIEDRAFVELPIAINVFKNQDAIAGLRAMIRIVIRLRHPKPSPIVQTKSNRLLTVRLTGEKRHLKPLRHHHRSSRFGGGQWSIIRETCPVLGANRRGEHPKSPEDHQQDPEPVWQTMCYDGMHSVPTG